LLWVISAALVVFSCQEKLLATFSISMIVIVFGGIIIITYFAINNKLVKNINGDCSDMIVKGGYTNYGQEVGILMLETRFPRLPGDIGNAKTFHFR